MSDPDGSEFCIAAFTAPSAPNEFASDATRGVIAAPHHGGQTATALRREPGARRRGKGHTSDVGAPLQGRPGTCPTALELTTTHYENPRRRVPPLHLRLCAQPDAHGAPEAHQSPEPRTTNRTTSAAGRATSNCLIVGANDRTPIIRSKGHDQVQQPADLRRCWPERWLCCHAWLQTTALH
jgi:hypothetical protein